MFVFMTGYYKSRVIKKRHVKRFKCQLLFSLKNEKHETCIVLTVTYSETCKHEFLAFCKQERNDCQRTKPPQL